jgi:two-component system, OmpR family, KDP operon response regulator KdpE
MKNAVVGSQVQHVLVIEDDSQIRRFLRTTLSAERYRLHEAATAADGIRQAASRQPDAILLELVLPDGDGLDVITHIRQWNATVPIIVISVRDHERDKVRALDAGADDFVSKPFSVRELLARLRAGLRRSAALPDTDVRAVFRTGGIEVDLNRRRVRVEGNDVHLTRIEYKLLQTLMRYHGRVLTHGQLLNEVWGPNHTNQSHYLRVYMAQLRRKLEADPARPHYLLTEPGVGYRLIMDEDGLA